LMVLVLVFSLLKASRCLPTFWLQVSKVVAPVRNDFFFVEYDGEIVNDASSSILEEHKYYFALPKSKLAINGATSRGIAPVINHDLSAPNCYSRWERVMTCECNLDLNLYLIADRRKQFGTLHIHYRPSDIRSRVTVQLQHF
jgi:hypothetical protein